MSSQLSWKIIKHFSSRNTYGFTFQDVTRAFPEKNRVHLTRILAEMVKKGMLCKITRGNYHIIPINADPETYVPDIHRRLIEYKRIASATDDDGLKDIQIELIDRFGLLPDPLKHLFRITQIKLRTLALGVEKIDVSEHNGKFVFNPNPNIDPLKIIELIQSDPQQYRFDGKQTLRFACQNVELEPRLKQVENLIMKLTAE